MRSSLASVCLRAIAQARQSDKVQTVKFVAFHDRAAEIFKDVCEQKNIHQQVVVVIVLHCVHAVARPHSLRAFVVFLVQQFVLQVVVEGFCGRQLRLFILVSARHKAVRRNSFGKRAFVVRIHVPGSMHKVVFSALAK